MWCKCTSRLDEFDDGGNDVGREENPTMPETGCRDQLRAEQLGEMRAVHVGHLASSVSCTTSTGTVMRSANFEISKLSTDAPTRCSSARTMGGRARSGR